MKICCITVLLHAHLTINFFCRESIAQQMLQEQLQVSSSEGSDSELEGIGSATEYKTVQVNLIELSNSCLNHVFN